MSRSGYLDQLQWGVDFVEDHLDEPFELVEVARVAGLSRWHFQRTFKALTGDTLKSYIRSRRLAVSLDRLLSTDMRIIDIAILAGYETQESYTRAFKKAVGVTPNEYRKLGNRRLHLAKVQFDADYLAHVGQNISLAPRLEEWPPMRLVGLRTTFYGSDSEKNNIGDQLPDLWDRFVPRLDEIDSTVPGRCYEVIRQETADGERLVYDAAIEVERSPEVLPEGMVTLVLPPARRAVFAHRGPASDLDHSVNYVYSTWLTQSGARHTGGADVEIYGPAYQPTSPDSEIEYSIPVAGSGAEA